MIWRVPSWSRQQPYSSEFSRDALAYCREITQSTHLQFLLVPGTVVNDYLTKGASSLIDHATKNAKDVMRLKRAQPIRVSDDIDE